MTVEMVLIPSLAQHLPGRQWNLGKRRSRRATSDMETVHVYWPSEASDLNQTGPLQGTCV